MEATQSRRKVVTYGKSRKLHTDSIFDDHVMGKPHIETRNLSRQSTPTTSITKKRSPNGMEIRKLEATARPSSPSVRRDSPYAADNSQDSSDSSSTNSSQRYGSANSSILDMLDSDEEACAQQLQPVEVKRRKITPLSRQPQAASNPPVLGAKSASSRVMRDVPKTHVTMPRQIEAGTTQRSGMNKRQGLPSTRRERSVAHSVINSSRSKTASGLLKSPNSNLPSIPANLPKRHAEKQKLVSPVQDEEQATSELAEPQTPRARKTLQSKNGSTSPFASPSQLGLNSLRLTPDKRDQQITFGTKKNPGTPRRVRQKLHDDLDAPGGRGTSRLSSPGIHTEMKNSSDKILTARVATSTQPPTLADPTFANAPTPRKPLRTVDDASKITYAKERSHLSDMVDEIDEVRTSQLRAVVPASSLDLLNPVALVVDELDDSDEMSAATAVKSIHELRQAGIDNRFERDMETLFEDIEVYPASSRALKIHALLQLNQKLQDSNLARQFVESGMISRLAAVAETSTDIVSAVLLTLVLIGIVALEHVSSQLLATTFQALLRLSPEMLQYTQPFTKVVASRKRNLSKIMIRELETWTKEINVEVLRSIKPWTPRQLALACLERLLRTMRGSKSSLLPLPAALFNQILELLSETLKTEEWYELEKQLAPSALTILEYSAVSQAVQIEADDMHLNYSLLGDVTTRLMHRPASEPSDVKSIGLRLVVSLTNNEPVICTALAQTDLIAAVFSVVEQDLPALIDNADSGDEFDDAKLDSVIMALGCLLNLADCSSVARERMHATDGASSSSVHWLVSVFNRRVGRAEEATTIAQSQVLVAFGYLSMLLCTLCLDDEIYTYIAEAIAGKNVTALCREAQEFLDKLETVASLNPDDPATGAFTERFRTILVGLRARMG